MRCKPLDLELAVGLSLYHEFVPELIYDKLIFCFLLISIFHVPRVHLAHRNSFINATSHFSESSGGTTVMVCYCNPHKAT